MPQCRSGLEKLLTDEPSLMAGRRVGLICNPTAVDREFRHAADLLHHHPGMRLVRLFGPEHGVRGDAQDMIAVEEGEGERDALTGLPVVSLYGHDEASLRPPRESLRDLDALIFDVQDIGSRYYTFVYTMVHAMEVAAQEGVSFIVCDRPNPIGGVAVEGPILEPSLRSFVGRHPIPVRHGCTAGELALLWREQLGLDLDLRVVKVEGWTRNQWHADTGLPWVMPSPNMPTPDTATVYPGMCLLEGTLMSEGRGTTRPFELSGAEWAEPVRLAETLRKDLDEAESHGAIFRPVVFRPTFHKFAGRPCGGVQIHVTDREKFAPFLTGIAFLAAAMRLWPGEFRWRTERYEFVSDRLAIDLLLGRQELRHAIEAGAPLADIRQGWQQDLRAWEEIRAPFLLYGREP